MRPALLLVDLQNDFLGAAGLEPEASVLVRRAARLLCGVRAFGLPVLHAITSVDPAADDRMPHWKAAGTWKCVPGTRGAAVPPELSPSAGEAVVSKTFFSAFGSRDLDAALARSNADTLVLAGVHLHGCVRATALDAYQRGFEVWIAEDAVGSDDPLHAAVTRRYLDGRAARFAPVEELLSRISNLGRPAAPGALVHRSPSDTTRTLFTVPVEGTAEAADAAVAAREAGERWRTVPPRERAARLEALARRLDDEAGALARDLAVDVGKPAKMGEAEARRAAELVRAAAILGVEGARPAGRDSSYRRAPLGVVAAVTPWNNPVAIPLGKIAPALALGNAVVWKPAPAGTSLARRLLELAREAGLPEGLLGVVTGDHRAAAAVMNEARVDAVTLTGSSTAGWAAQEICARRRIPLQAELGGNNGSIVWEGADLDRVAALVAFGAFAFAGQRCTANRRAIVQAAFFDRFVESLESAAGALAWGDPLDPATDVGPLISLEARDRVADAVARAAGEAERVLARHADRAAAELYRRGAYHPPTIVAGADPGSAIVQEETFGPVLVIQRANDFGEALELLDGVRQGLAASLFSGPGPWRGEFDRVARAGILKWDASTADADAFAPFGGWKASGLGPPEHGPGNAEFYGRLQAIYGEP
jgi:alpha-ketoglutaric semialdehyde dehydrogenase